MVPIIVRLFRSLPALFALVCATTGQGADPIYRKVGDSVVLNPGQPFNAISSATWKHNTDLASEWFGTGNVDCYRDFKGRCSLNKKDGSFTISNLKVEDSGSYTPEINDKVLNQLELQVIEPVPKPTVSVKCNYEKTLCNLTCEANINPDVGTVKYEWRTGEVVLSNNKELIITENKESSFICMLKNRVSSSSSDGVDNPLSRGNPGAAAGLAAAIVILIVAAALAVIGRFGWYWFKNRKFPTWKEFWCRDKKKPKQGDAESAEQTKLLHFTSENPDSETKTNNHEPNVRWSTPTVQNGNENKDKTSHGNNEKADDQHQKPALNSFSKNQGDSRTVEQPFKGSGTNISQSTEEANQNPPPVNPVPSGQTEGEASPIDEKKNNLHQKPALNSFNVNQGDFSAGEPPFKGSGTNISVSSEKDDLFYPASNTVPSGPTEGEAPPGDKEEKNENNQDDKKKDDQGQKSPTISASENQGEQHQDLSPEEETRKQSEDDAGSAEEGEASLKDNEEKDDLHKKSPTISANENQGQQHQDLSPEEETRKQSEDKDSPSGDEGTEDLGQKLPTIPFNENPGEQHRHLNPEGETRNQSENNQDGDNQQGKQLFPGVTSKTANDETNISGSAKEHEENHPARETLTSDVKVSSSDEEKDDLHKKSPTISANENQGEQHRDLNPEGETRKQSEGEASPSGVEGTEENNQDGDNQQGKQLFPGVTSKTANDETNISGSAKEHEENHPARETLTSDVKVSSSDEEKDEDKDSPNNCKKTDDQGKESAEKSSGVKLGEQHLNSNSNRIQQPYDGTENTSVEPSGPETSEQGSAV